MVLKTAFKFNVPILNNQLSNCPRVETIYDPHALGLGIIKVRPKDDEECGSRA